MLSCLDFNSSSLLLPLSFASAPSLPKFAPSQFQAFHRRNLSEEAEGSEEQVAPGTFADGHFRGCFAGLPHQPAPLPSPAFPPEPFPHFPKHLRLQASAKSQAERLFTAAVVSASWHPTSSLQIVLIIHLRISARKNCWGASRLKALSESGRKKTTIGHGRCSRE